MRKFEEELYNSGQSGRVSVYALQECEGWRSLLQTGEASHIPGGKNGMCKGTEAQRSMAVPETSRMPYRQGRGAQKASFGTSLVVQWLRLCPPVKGAQVRSLVRKLDPVCCS